MKCKVCREHAVVDIRRHNAGFCRDHFLEHARNQVARAIKEFKMFRADDRLLLAVSGGKDSLALWDILIDLGYDVTGFYLDLGIGGYSNRSKDLSISFAAESLGKAPGSVHRNRTRFQRPRVVQVDRARPLLGLRIEQALRVQSRRARGGIRGARHRSQPR